MLFRFVISAFAFQVQAAKHHLFVGSYGTPFIYGIDFNNVANTLEVTKNNTTRPENEWLALSYDSKTLYSSGKSGWSSFNITSPGVIGWQYGAVPASGRSCGAWNGVYAMASKRPPYPLYGSLTCANWVSVSPTGTISKATEIPYNDGAVMYGMTPDPTWSYLYSSDSKNGRIWTHRINIDGSLSRMGSVMAPSAVSSPRTMLIHPSGRALYVVLEAWNAIALYYINQTTHLPEYTNALYPLIPTSANAGNYGAQSAVLSTKGSMIWATAHSRVLGQPGYMTALSLAESGLPTAQLWQVKTPTSGGKSLNIAACPWSERLIALSDSEIGSVSIWESGKSDAILLASVEIQDAESANEGCCSNVVWVD